MVDDKSAPLIEKQNVDGYDADCLNREGGFDRQTSPSWSHRSLGEMSVGGIRHSILTLTSTAVGGGILSISYMVHLCGVGLGTLMLVCGASVSYVSIVVLMHMSTEGKHESYSKLFSHCAGRLAGPILDAMLFIYGAGACVGYLVFLGDFIPSLISLIHNAPGWLGSRAFAICASSIIAAPAVVQRDVAVLRYMTPISILALVYVTVIIAGSAPGEYISNRGTGSIQSFRVSLDLFEALPISMFAFNCHMNVVPVAGGLVRPTKRRIEKVTWRVQALQFLLYACIGIAGYISFLDQTDQDILVNYSKNDRLMVIARVLLSLTMLVAVPINSVPTVQSGLRLIGALGNSALVPAAFRMRADSDLIAPPSPDNISRPLNAPVPVKAIVQPAWPRILLSLVCLFAEAMIAIQVPGIADVIGLLGATIAPAVMMVIPAYCMGKCMPKTARNRAKQVFLLIFAVLSFAAVPVKILRQYKILS